MDRLAHIREELNDLLVEIDLRLLLQKLAEKIKHFLACAEASIFLYDSAQEELTFEIATGTKLKKLKEIRLPKGQGIAGWIAEKDCAVIVNDCSRDERFFRGVDRKISFHTRSILGVPVHAAGKTLGILEAINKYGGDFSDQDRGILELIAQFVSSPLQNAMLFKKLRQEMKEKRQLLRLSKKISFSFNSGDIFAIVQEILRDLLDPLSIHIFVQGSKRHFRWRADKDEGTLIAGGAKNFADEYLLKIPLKTSRRHLGFLEIGARRRVPAEVASLIHGFASFLAIAIEKYELQQQMLEKERMEKELQIARAIQQSFLIQQRLQFPGIDVAFVNVPSSAVGGDYYEILPLDERSLVVSVNDIAGHGLPASLLMAIFRTNFVYRLKRDRDIRSTLTHLNSLIAETTDANLYVTSFTGLVDVPAGKFRYINAGHPPALLLRGDRLEELSGPSLVVGMFSDTAFSLVEQDVQRDDLLLLFTDGLLEAENPAGEMFGRERLATFLQRARHWPAEEIKCQLLTNLREFHSVEHFADDVTFIVLRIL